MVRVTSGLEAALGAVEQQGSAGEKQIARMLARYGIRFMYEHPVAVTDRGRLRIWYQDLWLPDYSVAIEYAGLNSNDNPDYAAGIEHKKAVYASNGIPCVFMSKDMFEGCWPKHILREIRSKLAERLEQFDSLDVPKSWD